MSKQVNIRFRLKTLGGNIRMITRDAYEYFKNEPDILRVSDITRLLHCSKNTIYELVKDGRLPSIRLGRSILIPKTALVEMMVNEKYYQIVYPYPPRNSWTSEDRSRILGMNKKPGKSKGKPA